MVPTTFPITTERVMGGMVMVRRGPFLQAFPMGQATLYAEGLPLFQLAAVEIQRYTDTA